MNWFLNLGRILGESGIVKVYLDFSVPFLIYLLCWLQERQALLMT